MEASADQRIVVGEITTCTPTTACAAINSGLFSFLLILDDGAEERLVLPSAEAAKVVMRLLRGADTAFFDVEKRVTASGALGRRSSRGAGRAEQDRLTRPFVQPRQTLEAPPQEPKIHAR